MGRAARPRPSRLGEKLLCIRSALGLSQDGMVVLLSTSDTLTSASISAYERGQREPPLPVLLEYARIANVYLDVLADDDLDLPEGIPANSRSKGTPRKKRSNKASRKKR
jgi:transcriptional regulator with XRE-family HTH domain